jgi:hypothetical protein
MWNFVGRQNDNQGRYGNQDGNWMRINFVTLHLGSQEKLTTDMLTNKGRNVYYFLPFILGLMRIMFPEVEMKKVFTYCYPYSYSQVSFENIFK